MAVGQMMTQMLIGAPSVAATAVIAPLASAPGNRQDTDAFEGVLRNLSTRGVAKPVSGNAAKASQTEDQDEMGAEAAETQQNVAVSRQTGQEAGKEGSPPVSTVDGTTSESPDQPGQQKIAIPQNVVFTAPLIQLAGAQRIDGGAPNPAVAGVVDGNATSAQVAETAAIPQNVVFPASPIQLAEAQRIGGGAPNPAVAGVVEGDAPPAQVAESSGIGNVSTERGNLTATVLSNPTTPVIGRTAAMDAVLSREIPLSSAVSPEPSQPMPGVTAKVGTAGVDKGNIVTPRMDASVTSTNAVREPVDPQLSARAIKPAEAVTSVSTVREPVGRVDGSGFVCNQEITSVGTVRESDAVVPEIMDASTDVVTGRVGTVSVREAARPALDAYFRTSVAPRSSSAADAAPVTQSVNASTVTAEATRTTGVSPSGQVQFNAPVADTRTVREATPSKSESPEKVDGLESGNGGGKATKKEISSSDGESPGRNDNGGTEQGMAKQSHVAQVHPLKVEGPSVSTGVSAVKGGEHDIVQQVIGRVSEHLAGNGTKNGAEQVVIRLSPESLGELKLNLRMENQCLKVEIVTENSTVRDALIKHSDTLRETLARQNISMEMFDVSTGSNGNGSTSYGKGDWRELAQRQQQVAGNFSGSYRAGDSAENAHTPIYRNPVEYSMVDVHF